MAITYYDIAIANKINNWLPKDNKRKIQVLKPDEVRKLFSIELDEKNDKPIQLPLIALSRDPSITLKQPTMTPMSFDGVMLESDSLHTIQLDAIPIDLNYQLDVYTRKYDEGDFLLRDLLFKIMNNPQVVITLPYNGQELKQVATIILSPTVEDNSDISERLFSGQFTRWTLRFKIDGAYIYNIPYVDNVQIDYELDMSKTNFPPYEMEYEDSLEQGE